MIGGIKNKRIVFIFIIFGTLVILNLFAWRVVIDLARQKPFTVIFFDVGQGDATFIETPQRQKILIDGGPDSSVLAKLAKFMPFYNRSLDLIILSHPEKDHLTGLLEVLKRYKVENILWTGVVRDIPEWQEWEKLIGNEKAVVKTAHSGQKIILDGNPLMFINLFYPFENLAGQNFKDSNDTSIACKLVVADNSFLFTGDISKSVEQKLTNLDIGSDVLKIAHHGSKNSSSEEFLKTVSPKVAVIPVGKNNYGHPHLDILARLQDFGIDILRTDRDKDIKIISNGKTLKVGD